MIVFISAKIPNRSHFAFLFSFNSMTQKWKRQLFPEIVHPYRFSFRQTYLKAAATPLLNADRQAVLCKMNAEARLMTRRMGKKLAELSKHIFPDETAARWLGDIAGGRTPGTYPVAQGIVFAACGISEKELFCSHQYGVVNMVVSAALRCVRVSHYDTQRILFRAAEKLGELYDTAGDMDFDDMYTFVPQIDILASLHEKGTKRMFMN